MAQDTEVPTKPELERRTRRKFSSADKRRLLAEYDNLLHREKGAWLRRQGLYAAQLTGWRRILTAQGAEGLEPKTGGRKSKDSRDRRVEARTAYRIVFDLSAVGGLLIKPNRMALPRHLNPQP